MLFFSSFLFSLFFSFASVFFRSSITHFVGYQTSDVDVIVRCYLHASLFSSSVAVGEELFLFFFFFRTVFPGRKLSRALKKKAQISSAASSSCYQFSSKEKGKEKGEERKKTTYYIRSKNCSAWQTEKAARFTSKKNSNSASRFLPQELH